MKLRLRLTLLFVLLITVSASIIFLLALGNTSRVLVRQVEQHVDSLAAAKEDEVEIYVQGQFDRLRGVASRTKVRDALSNFLSEPNEDNVQAISQILLDVIEPFVDVRAVSIFQPSGAFISGSAFDTTFDSTIINRLIQEAQQQESLVATQLDTLYIAGPIVQNDQLLGIAVIELASNQLTQAIVDYTGLGETGELLLAVRNADGDAQFLHTRRFEADPNAFTVVSKNEVDVPMTQALLRRETLLLDALDYRGQPVIAATRYVENVDWGLVVKIDQEEVLKNLNDFRATLLLLLLVVVFFTAMVAYISSVALVQPLEVLTGRSQDVAGGNLDIKIATGLVEQRDEIGMLAKSFSIMTGKLQQIYQGLENTVRDRTKKLQQSLDIEKQQRTELERTKDAMLNLLEDLQDERNQIQLAMAKDEAILSSLGDGLIVTDQDGKILLVNSAFERMLGWKKQEVLNKELVSVIPLLDEMGGVVDTNKRFITMALRKQSTVTTANDAFLYRRKDGTSFPIAINVSPILLKGKLVGAVEVFRDVTHEKAIDKVKTEFVSLASHQLRTPLSAINWYAEMLLAEDAGTLTKEQKQYMNEIYLGNQRMVDLVNALLDVSRLELGTFSVEPEPTDVVQLAKDTVREQEPEIFKRKQKLVEHYAEDLPSISLDSKLMKIVIQNVVSNAIKYTPEEGTIEVTLSQQGKNLRLEVKDSGYGIPQDQQDKIFSKLFRADNVKEHDTSGTGLGLYLVKSIVEHSGGRIWFESAEGEGTTFYIELPMTGMQAKEGTKRLGD